MATYKVTDPGSGKTVTLTGDSPPTEVELNDIFSSISGEGAKTDVKDNTSVESKKERISLASSFDIAMDSAKNTVVNTLKSVSVPGIQGFGSKMAIERPQDVALATSFGAAPVATLASLATRKLIETDKGKKIVNDSARALIENVNQVRDRIPTDMVAKIQSSIINPKNEKFVVEGIKALAETASGLGAEAAGEVVFKNAQKVAKATSSKIINGLLKAKSAKNFSYGKNPGRGVAEEGIIANSFEDMATKIDDSLGRISDELTDEVAKSGSKTFNIEDDINDVITDEIIKLKKNPRQNASAIKRIEDVRDDLLEKDFTTGLPSRDLKKVTAVDILDKKRAVGEQTRFTGNPSDDAQVNGVLKKIFGTLKSKLKGINPKTAKLTEKMADLITAKALAKNNAALSQGRTFTDLGNLLTLGLGTATTGGNIVGGILAIGAKKAIESPTARTSIAKAMTKISKVKLDNLGKVVPLLQPMIDRLPKEGV